MKRETAVEKLINEISKDRIGQAIIKTFFKEFEDAKKLEREQKMDFANWCRIHDNKYPNTVMTIQQLYDKYEKELGWELESANSSERKNTLSDYGVAGEDNSIEYANENTSDTESIQWTGGNLEEINEFLKKNNKHFKYLAQRLNDGNLIITKKDTGLDILWIGLNEYLVISNNKIILIPYGEMTNRPKKPQRKPIVQEELAQDNTSEEQNNPEPSTPRVRLENSYKKIQIKYASDEAPENAVYDDEGVIWTPLKETTFLKSKLNISTNSPFEVRAEIVELFIMTPFNDLRKRILIKESLKAMLIIGEFYELYPSKRNIEKFMENQPNKTIGFSQIVLEYRLATEYQDIFGIKKVGITHEIFKEGMDNVVEFLITNIFKLDEKTSAERVLLSAEIITAMILTFLNGEGYLGFYSQNSDKEDVLKGWYRVRDINDKQVVLENLKSEPILIKVDDFLRRINIKLTAIHKPNLNVGDAVRIIDEECSEFGRMGIIKGIMVESDRRRYICTEIEIHNGAKRYGLFITPFSSLEKLNQITNGEFKEPQSKPIVQEELAPHNAPEEQNNEPMIQEAKIRLQTALDIFELEEWKMEAFGIRTPKEFEDYREQRKQLYEKCKTIEQAEREKLIREACNVCKTEFRKFKKTTVEEVVNQVLNK